MLIFERSDFSGQGERYREQLDLFVSELEGQAKRFEESRDRALERAARRGERSEGECHRGEQQEVSA